MAKAKRNAALLCPDNAVFFVLFHQYCINIGYGKSIFKVGGGHLDFSILVTKVKFLN